MTDRITLTETVNQMENARLISVIYSDEFLEIFYALENVVKSYEDMMDIFGPVSHARHLVNDYKSKYNLESEFE